MPDSKKNDAADVRGAKTSHEKRLRPVLAFFCRQDAQLLIFAFFFAVLSWPFLTIANRAAPFYRLLAYLFGIWLVMIVVLAITGSSLRKNGPTRPATDMEEGR